MSAIATLSKIVGTACEGVKVYRELQQQAARIESDVPADEHKSVASAEGVFEGDVPNEVSDLHNVESPKKTEALVDEFKNAPCDGVKVVEAGHIIDSIEEFRQDKWEKLSVEEKRDALQRLENKLAESSCRPACNIRIEKMEEGLNGYHNDTGIAISESRVEVSKNAVQTLVHEGRHEYQMHNIRLLKAGEHVVEPSQEKVESWYINVVDLGYEDGHCGLFDFKRLGFKRYLAQPIEVDARVFAESALANSTIMA